MRFSLVIVESPAKCKKIESYLGPGYKCIASYGHLRELKSLENIRRSDNYNIFFDNVDDSKKKKHIEFMRKDIAAAEEVILATDDDREGEAIAWHICKIFDLEPTSTKRIVFHEITENALQSAIMHPRKINMNVVYAQQARQVLDLVVGFKVSPLLWKHVSQTNLSAGRCQTPALRIVYDNQKEIDKSPGTKVYTTVGYFGNKCMPFEMNKTFSTEDEIHAFLKDSIPFSHVFDRSDVKRVAREPPEPLTTSRLQQLASNEMRISPKETMKLCQTLYEAGYITYMRTDSKKYSPEFVGSVKTYILKSYGEDRYIHPNIDSLAGIKEKAEEKEKKSKKEKEKEKKKSNAPPPQEAHEAIRPTNIGLKDVPDDLSARERKMYNLIWQTSLESCMAAAIFYTFIATLSTCLKAIEYRSTQELIDFPGWKIVKGKFSTVNKEYSYLQQLKVGTVLPYKKITSKVTITGTKQHYTEAKLVQLLEEKGIGRPSTFSTIIDKIQERGYVSKQDIPGRKIECKDFSLEEMKVSEEIAIREFGSEKSKLVIQPVGTMAINFLMQHFDSLFNYNYTKEMEDELDKIGKGELVPWYQVCENCWTCTEDICNSLKGAGKQEIVIDDNHVYTIAKYGPVIKCQEGDKTTFKNVRKDIDIEKLIRGEYRLEEILEDKTISSSVGEYQGHVLFVKKGKYGRYASWGTNNKSLAGLGNRPIENIEFEEIIAEIEKNGVPVDGLKPESNIIREVSETISIRKGQYGDYIFYKTKKMKKPSFLKLDGCKLDYKTCNSVFLKDWLLEKYSIQ